MQFKLKNTTFKISFSFLALILLILTVDKGKTFGLLMFFAVLHELVHLLFICLFSVPPQKIAFTIFGANITRNIKVHNSKIEEILINGSAPVFNIVTGVVFYILSNKVLSCSPILTEISEINFVLGLFNLIPFYTFDGGNVLKYILLLLFNEKTTDGILAITSLITTIAFSFLSIYIFLNYEHNFSLFVMCIYMFMLIIFKKENSLDY